MSNTQGLDALAALCGYTAAAASKEKPEAHAGAAPSVSATVSLPQQQGGSAVASLYSQQQQQLHQQQALQLQQVQHVLAMRQAAVAAAQQQQQQQQAVSIPSQFVEQAKKQLQNLLAAQQQQQQVQQQQRVNPYGEGYQALAAQLLAVQQHHVNNGAAAVAAYHHPGLAATLSPAALASLVVNAGGANVASRAATLSQLASSSPSLSLSPGFHSADNNNNQTTSPSTTAMPPPPSKLVPSLPLSNNFGALNPECTDGGTSTGKQSSSRSKLSRAKAVTAAPIDDIIMEWEDKKQVKRAANRLSANLSRKRKKLLLEDLKDENVELRRKEQILRSIPDLIVVFDSSGCISFISHSVTRFMNYDAEELEDTSFWDRLTEESVRLIKSAFMDALAMKRHSDEDSTPLAKGESMTVTLIPKKEKDSEGNAGGDDDQGLLVSLKGVVHFGEEYPECVCSIRPEGMATSKPFSATAATVSSRNRQERGQEHQISDIDSEKS